MWKNKKSNKYFINFVSETVIIVPAANTVGVEQSEQNENIQQIRQSREIGPNTQNNAIRRGSSIIFRDANLSKPIEKHELDKNQAENDDEQYLMSNKVYRKTTKALNRKDEHPRSSKWATVNCRTVLWYIAFVGFMVNYMYRININIAIVHMVSIKKTTISTNDHTSECVSQQIFETPVNVTTENVKIIFIHLNFNRVIYFRLNN